MYCFIDLNDKYIQNEKKRCQSQPPVPEVERADGAVVEATAADGLTSEATAEEDPFEGRLLDDLRVLLELEPPLFM
jgi:hypothetical protein